MKKLRRTLGIAASLALSLGILFPLSLRATEPADDTQEEGTYQDGQEDEAYIDTRSGDNSLSTLSISPGILSPEFKYSVINYTASVGADVTSVDVEAETSNAAAKILSITGNTDLQEGENTIRISVEAENGAPVTYQIVVTRGGASQDGESEPDSQEGETQKDEDASQENGGEQEVQAGNPDGITINGHPFNLTETVPEDVIPKGFSVAEVTFKGQQVQGLQFDKEPSLKLLYLTTPSTEVKNTLAVCEESSGSVYPFRKVSIGKKYVILLDPPAEAGISEPYTQASVKIGKYEDVPVFEKEGSEFSLVYAASSQGNIGWYQYDTVEKSFQRYVQDEAAASGLGMDDEESSAQMQGLRNAYKDLEEQYNNKKDSSRKTISVLAFVIAVLVIVIINLLLHRRRRDDEWEEDEEAFEAPKAKKRRNPRKDMAFEEEPEPEDMPFGIRRGKKANSPEEVIDFAASKSGRKRHPQEEGDVENNAVRPSREERAKRMRKAWEVSDEHGEEEENWQEEDPVFAELNPRSRKRMKEDDDWDQKNLDSKKADWDQNTPASKEGWDAPKPRRNLNETAELKLDDDFEVIDLEDL